MNDSYEQVLRELLAVIEDDHGLDKGCEDDCPMVLAATKARVFLDENKVWPTEKDKRKWTNGPWAT